MAGGTIACARCVGINHLSDRFCASCGLPLGTAQADAGAVLDLFRPYESPEPSDSVPTRAIRDLVLRSGYESSPFGPGWRVSIPLHLDRSQAVYVGPAGTDPEGRAVLTLISVCGPANLRDAPKLLKLNAWMVEGHFAIRVLRGEEYFVVVQALAEEAATHMDAPGLLRRIAQAADGLEDQLSRGRDIY